jgi:hypothetical protein
MGKPYDAWPSGSASENGAQSIPHRINSGTPVLKERMGAAGALGVHTSGA